MLQGKKKLFQKNVKAVSLKWRCKKRNLKHNLFLSILVVYEITFYKRFKDHPNDMYVT